MIAARFKGLKHRAAALVHVSVALCLAAVSQAAAADDYPSRTVKVVVAYAPGGAVDNMGRLLAQKLSEKLKHSFVVENMPGAAGVVAVSATMRAPADGYTLLLTDSQFMIAPALLKTPPYDPLKSLTPVSLVGTVPFFFVVKGDKPWKSLNELLAHAKAHPDKPLTYGTAGIGSVHHLSMEAFKAVSGTNFIHVPYKGSGESVQALLSGNVDILVASPTTVQAHQQNGTVRYLAVTSGKRVSYAPDVPSVGEAFPGYDYVTGVGLLAPPGTPEPIREKIATSLREVMKQPEVEERLTKVNRVNIEASSPQEYARIITDDAKRFVHAVSLANIEKSN